MKPNRSNYTFIPNPARCVMNTIIQISKSEQTLSAIALFTIDRKFVICSFNVCKNARMLPNF